MSKNGKFCGFWKLSNCLVHFKMVAIETISIYPDAIFRYICELQFIICSISKKYFKYLTQSTHVWVLITKMLYQKRKNVGFCPI